MITEQVEINNPERNVSLGQSVEINATQGGELPTTIKICPVPSSGGTIKGVDGREYLLDTDKVIRNTNALSADVVIDENHSSYNWASSTAPAMGWLKNLRKEKNFIVADVEWTERGEQLVKNRSYRYVSPAFLMSSDARVNRIDSVGLVTMPNLSLPALNNTQTQNENTQTQKEKRMDEEDEKALVILNKSLNKQVTEMTAEAIELNKKVSELTEQNKKLQDELAKQLSASKEAEIELKLNSAIAEGRILPAQKESFKSVGLNSVEQLDSLLGSMPANSKVDTNVMQTQQTQGGLPPAPGREGVQLNAAQRESAKARGMTDQEYFDRYLKENK